MTNNESMQVLLPGNTIFRKVIPSVKNVLLEITSQKSNTKYNKAFLFSGSCFGNTFKLNNRIQKISTQVSKFGGVMSLSCIFHFT